MLSVSLSLLCSVLANFERNAMKPIQLVAKALVVIFPFAPLTHLTPNVTHFRYLYRIACLVPLSHSHFRHCQSSNFTLRWPRHNDVLLASHRTATQFQDGRRTERRLIGHILSIKIGGFDYLT